jgi:hypothetical protein
MAGSTRPPRPPLDRPKPRETDANAPRRKRAIDNVVAYSPKGAGLVSGLLGVLASPNRWVGAALVVSGTVVDVVSTWWDRRQRRKE